MIDGIKVYRLAAKFMDFLNIRFLKKEKLRYIFVNRNDNPLYRILKTIPNMMKKSSSFGSRSKT